MAPRALGGWVLGYIYIVGFGLALRKLMLFWGLFMVFDICLFFFMFSMVLPRSCFLYFGLGMIGLLFSGPFPRG